MPKKIIETITLEPITPIISFDAISYRAYVTVSGTIGHYRYPSDAEYASSKKAFFSSGIGHRNKQKISEVISEIYAYLNTKISDHADTADYYFRISFRIEVNKDTAEIVGTPSFDIDVFRHIGKIGGRHSNTGKYLMQVVIVDKDTVALSPIFKKGVSKARQEAGLIEFKIYESYSKAPDEVKQRINKDSYFLIIDEEAHKIEPEIDPKTKDVIYSTLEEGRKIEFRSEHDVFNYVLKHLKITPKIIGSETGLSFVDKEIVEISKELQKGETEPKVNLVAQLGIEQSLIELFGKLDGFKARANSEKAKFRDRYKADLEKIQEEFKSLKVELEVQESELSRCEEEYNKTEITEENYRTYRVKTLKALAVIKSNLTELQKNLKEKYSKDIDDLISAKGKGAK